MWLQLCPKQQCNADTMRQLVRAVLAHEHFRTITLEVGEYIAMGASEWTLEHVDDVGGADADVHARSLARASGPTGRGGVGSPSRWCCARPASSGAWCSTRPAAPSCSPR